MEIFEYSYMVRALIVGFALSIIIPIMGIVVVNKRISLIGDALSHVSLAGVLIGILTGLTPIVGAILLCICASLFLEFIRKKFPSYQEISTAIIMSTGIGLASLLTSFVRNGANFESFLFGSIIAITNFEFYLILVTSAIVFITFSYFYRDLMHVSFDEVSARLSGINVSLINSIFIVLISITISVASRTVGILIISSLMVIPVACAMKFELGYFKTIVLSSFFGLFFVISGLILSFYLNLKPGGTIVLTGVITLIIILFITNFKIR